VMARAVSNRNSAGPAVKIGWIGKVFVRMAARSARLPNRRIPAQLKLDAHNVEEWFVSVGLGATGSGWAALFTSGICLARDRARPAAAGLVRDSRALEILELAGEPGFGHDPPACGYLGATRAAQPVLTASEVCPAARWWVHTLPTPWTATPRSGLIPSDEAKLPPNSFGPVLRRTTLAQCVMGVTRIPPPFCRRRQSTMDCC
jgi:hypothetical protein